MCVYPLLFKQAVTAENRLKQCRAELKGESRGLAEEPSVPPPPIPPEAIAATNKMEQVFDVIHATLGRVNEDVRTLEGHMRTMDVLVGEVRGGDALLSATRVLKREALVDMKLNNFSFRNVLGTNISVKRASYKWYVFADEVLVCKQGADQLYHMKALFSLRGMEEMVLLGKGGVQKPEVFFVADGGPEFKCWAQSEAEKNTLLALLEELRVPLRGIPSSPFTPGKF